MSDKYYIPEIEEFHIGFEFEITNGYEWVKKVFSKEDLKSFLYEQLENGINQQYIRVKYLDKEDIESLGWKHSGGKMLSGAMQYYDINKCRLYYAEHHPEYLSINVMETQVFRGRIKNKSELRKLMKQIGI